MSSQDDLDDDTSSLYGYATGLHDSIGAHVWKEADSSGSEGSRQEDDIYNEPRPPGHNSIHFLVGGEVANLYHEEPVVPVVHRHARVASQPTSIRSASNNNILISSKGSQMVRSQSQDINVALLENATSNPKPAQSESALDHNIKCKVIAARPQLPTAKEQSPLALEDDVCSTDSSVMDDEVKKRKRKIFGFSKKNKNKPE
ncbi:uncharacterized protein LOC112903991 isoform X1 [Agrilus planipennis]|uniref:Uncharacterized protein LOC112903991 isoform X1 n=1 Tax=Agrilus planipennis TaxID=224129 RepID=A0A7F5RLM4_AGRPL|nr:uncharacterized protein LOC112903991 isoform X1 [Agrilus planipennis]